MLSWIRGRAVALARREEDATRLSDFVAGLSGPKPQVRVPATAIYLTTREDVLPSALSLNLKHNRVLHEHLLLLKVTTSRAPRVAEDSRLTARDLAPGIRQIELRFGFAEKPDVVAALNAHKEQIGCDPTRASFFIGKRGARSIASSRGSALAGADLRLYG